MVDTVPVEDALYTELDFRIDLQRRANEAGVALTIPYVPKHPDHTEQPGPTSGRGNPARTESS